MDLSFENRTIVVTGASGALGKATCEALCLKGGHVVGLSRSIPKWSQPDRMRWLACDVSLESQVQEIFAKVYAEFGPVSGLVNNAADIYSAPIAETSLEVWNRMLATNLTSAFLCSRELFRRPHEDMRSIVNISSLGGISGTEKFPGFATYTATKSALIGLTEALAAEGKQQGIRVNAIAPGAFTSPMLERAAPQLRAKHQAEDLVGWILNFLHPSFAIANGSTLPIFCNAD